MDPSQAKPTCAEAYNCRRDCTTPDGQWDDEARAARACGLPGAPPPDPTARGLYEPRRGTPYMGRLPVLQPDPADYLGRRVNPDEPLELAADGCPGAWYRTALIEDVAPFVRRRTDTGDRVQNPRFDGAPWLVQDAALYYEAEQEQALAYLHAAIMRINEASRSKSTAGGTLGAGRSHASARPGRARR